MFWELIAKLVLLTVSSEREALVSTMERWASNPNWLPNLWRFRVSTLSYVMASSEPDTWGPLVREWCLDFEKFRVRAIKLMEVQHLYETGETIQAKRRRIAND